MTKVPTALGHAAKAADRLVMVGLRRVAVRKGKVGFLPKSRKIRVNRACTNANMRTHCGFLLAGDKIRYDVSVKAIVGFDGQRKPWTECDILFKPKLDGLPT